MRRLLARWCWLLALLPLAAHAHPMPESRVWIDARPWGMSLTLQLPLNRLEYGYGQALADEPAAVLPRHAEGLSRYLLQHVGARSDGQGWQVLRPVLRVVGTDGSAELEATLELHAPPGADTRRPTLLFDAIVHEVRTHRVLVSLRTDWDGGFVQQAPQPLGQLDPQHTSLVISLGSPSAGASWWRLTTLGATHILEGADHLLFLLLLLLTAPVVARSGRRAKVRPPLAATAQVARVVSGFTLGHSMTLALASIGWVSVPSRWVELAVAASIAVAALHVLWPRLQRSEAAMAMLFGLVHGLAFSATLAGAGLGRWQHLQSLLAFNLGIEFTQLAIVAVVLPPLLAMARWAPVAHARLQRGLALVALGVSGVWCAQRAGLGHIDTGAWTEQLSSWLPAAALGLWAVAALAMVRYRQARRRELQRAGSATARSNY